MTEKEYLLNQTGRWILAFIGLIQAMFVLDLLSSPFVWIWHSWDLAWKMGSTGLIGTLVMYVIYRFLKKVILESVEEELDE